MITARATATSLPFFFLSFCPTSGKEETEFQITHRWYNFHFSSPTAEARPPSAHPAPPPSEVKAGPGRAGQQRPRASPGGARQWSCGLPRRLEDQPQLRAPPALRRTWRRVGAGAAAANFVRAPWGRGSAVRLESAESRPRERGKARAHGSCSDAARRLDRAGCGARKTKNFGRDVPAAVAVRSQIHRPAPAERRAARATVDEPAGRSVRPRRAWCSAGGRRGERARRGAAGGRASVRAPAARPGPLPPAAAARASVSEIL